MYILKIHKYFFCIILFFLFCLQKSWAKNDNIPIKTLSAHFQREEISDNRISKTQGFIFYSNPNKIWIKVENPVNQFIKIDSSTMTIYYPDKNLVFDIRSRTSISLSFLTPFIASLRSDYGLSDLKYSIKNFQLVADTLISEWHPPKEAKNKLGIAKIKMIANKIIQVSIYNNSSQSSIQDFIFDNHVLINNIFWFPSFVSINLNTATDQTIDRVNLENINIDVALPDSIVGFVLPPNVTIKEFKW